MTRLDRARFGDCVLDVSCRRLVRGDVPVHLSSKAFDLLALLVERRPRALPKPELVGMLWPKTVVVEANLSNLIAEIRAAIGDAARAPRLIRTVHRYGYAFVGEVSTETQERTRARRDTLSWVIWGAIKVQLAEGDHLLGRHAGSIVPIDAATVSRHHAVIRVRGEKATVEDLGSRNGTALNGRLIDGPRELENGDQITVGPVTLTYRLASLDSPTVETALGAAVEVALVQAPSSGANPGEPTLPPRKRRES